MGMLHDRMEGDLKLRGLSPKTQRCYLSCARQFAAHYHRSPAEMGEREMTDFLRHLVQERQAAAPTIHMYVASLRFLYKVTLRRPDAVVNLPFPKVPRRIPEILTGSEVDRLISCITSIKYRTIAAAQYSAGLRISEARHLRPQDIDSARGVIQIREGKGRKGRQVALSDKLLSMLREYWRIERPQGEWLFPSPKYPTRPVGEDIVRRALQKAAQAARLRKKVTLHTMRHCFATHLLELGHDTEVIQHVLGHASVRTTRRYTHVRAEFLRRIRSPFDVIGAKEGEALR
jgi:site-specific recombinase XerD